MTKIKNFRITLRSREVLRTLRILEGDSFDPSWESCIEADLSPLKALVKPAAIYATLTQSTAVKATPLELPKKAVALSVLVVSVGTELAQSRLLSDAEGDARRVRLLNAVEKEALDQSVAFVMRLLQNQAKEEDCELADLHTPEQLQTAQKLTTLLGIERIGLSDLSEESPLPTSARLHYVLWMPAGKATKSTKSASKSSRSRSSEKANA